MLLVRISSLASMMRPRWGKRLPSSGLHCPVPPLETPLVFRGETSWRLTSDNISQMTAAPARPHRTRLLLANLDFVIVIMNGSTQLMACRSDAGGVFGRNVFYG